MDQGVSSVPSAAELTPNHELITTQQAQVTVTDSAQAMAEQATDSVQVSVEQTPYSILPNAKQSSDSVQATAQQLPDSVQATTQQLPDSVQATAQQVSDSVQATTRQLPDSVQATAQQTPDSVQAVSGQATDSVQHTTVQTPNTGSDATEHASDSSPSTARRPTDSVPLREHEQLTNLLSILPKKYQKGLFTHDIEWTSLAASKKHIALGSDQGTVFVYDRNKTSLQRLACPALKRQSVSCVRIQNSVDDVVAVGTETGTLCIYQLPSTLPGGNSELQVYVVPNAHHSPLSALEWSQNGMKLYSGDEDGLVQCTEIDYATERSCSYFVCKEPHLIAQLSYSQRILLVSTRYRSLLCFTEEENRIQQVGKKERKTLGMYGACFLPGVFQGKDTMLYAARPGLRLWKSDNQGQVQATYLLKDLLPDNSRQIPVLPGTSSRRGLTDPQLGPLYVMLDSLIFTFHKRSCLLIDPHKPGFSCFHGDLGEILSVGVTETEVFVLRKDPVRPIIRLATAMDYKLGHSPTDLALDAVVNTVDDALMKTARISSTLTDALRGVTGRLKSVQDGQRQISVPPWGLAGEKKSEGMTDSTRVGSDTKTVYLAREAKSVEKSDSSPEHVINEDSQVVAATETVESKPTSGSRDASPGSESPRPGVTGGGLSQRPLRTWSPRIDVNDGDDDIVFSSTRAKRKKKKKKTGPSDAISVSSQDSADSNLSPSVHVKTHSRSPSPYLDPTKREIRSRTPSPTEKEVMRTSSPNVIPNKDVKTSTGRPSPNVTCKEISTEKPSPDVTRKETITGSPSPDVTPKENSTGRPSPDVTRKETSTGRPSPDVTPRETGAGRLTPDVTRNETSTGRASPDVTPRGNSTGRPSPIVISTEISTRTPSPIPDQVDNQTDSRTSSPMPGSDSVQKQTSSRTSTPIPQDNTTERSSPLLGLDTTQSTVDSAGVLSSSVLDIVSDIGAHGSASRTNHGDHVYSQTTGNGPAVEIKGVQDEDRDLRSETNIYGIDWSVLKDERDQVGINEVSVENSDVVKNTQRDVAKLNKDFTTSEVSKLTPRSACDQFDFHDMAFMDSRGVSPPSKDNVPGINQIPAENSATAAEHSLNVSDHTPNDDSMSSDNFVSIYEEGRNSSFSSPEKEPSITEMVDSHDPKLKTDLKSPSIPSLSLISDSWSEYTAPGAVQSISISKRHIWVADKNERLFYSPLSGPELQWKQVDVPAKRIAVSPSGWIVWRLHKNSVYAGTTITTRVPHGLKSMEVARQVEFIAVDDNIAWYIKQNKELVVQKSLSRERPSFRSVIVACPEPLEEVSCCGGVVWGVTKGRNVLVRAGVTKGREEGTEWQYLQGDGPSLLASSISVANDNTAWLMDLVGRLWFTTDVTTENPQGSGLWWQVSLSEYFMSDGSALDTLKWAFALPQNLLKLTHDQQGGLVCVRDQGVWVCPHYKSNLNVCRGDLLGHRWEPVKPPGLLYSTRWLHVSATGITQSEGYVWTQLVSGSLFCIPVNRPEAPLQEIPSPLENGGPFDLVSASERALWGVDRRGNVYIRKGISNRVPRGVEWMRLDMTQLGSTHLVSLSCGFENVWAVDTSGLIYLRIGIVAPSQRHLNPAWVPVDGSTNSITSRFTSVAVGPNDWMVWAVDSRKNVYVRRKITDSLPVGTHWSYVQGATACSLTVSKDRVYAVTPDNEILVRYGICPTDVMGNYWRKIPGSFLTMSVTYDNMLWGIDKDSQLFRRHTYALQRNSVTDDDQEPTKTYSADDWEII